MKIKENITLYSCDYCKKKLQVKHAMIRHEEFCYLNPKNTPACSGCDFLKEIQKTIYFNSLYNPDSESSRIVKAFNCTKLNKELYPLSALRRDLPSKYPETFEDAELMPNNCEHFSFNPGF